MNESEFKKYIEDEWSFLIHEEGVWGGNRGETVHNINSMEKIHLKRCIAMIKRWDVRPHENETYNERVEVLKQKKLDELKSALNRK